MAWKSSFRQNYRTTFSPTFPTSAAGISHVVADVEAPVGEKWEYLKSGGKQWQTTPKKLTRMQRTRAIPVAWLSSGLCPDRPKSWIPIIIIIIIIIINIYIYIESEHNYISKKWYRCINYMFRPLYWPSSGLYSTLVSNHTINFMVTPCINNTEPFFITNWCT